MSVEIKDVNLRHKANLAADRMTQTDVTTTPIVTMHEPSGIIVYTAFGSPCPQVHLQPCLVCLGQEMKHLGEVHYPLVHKPQLNVRSNVLSNMRPARPMLSTLWLRCEY